jgi:hypothetical protein
MRIGINMAKTPYMCCKLTTEEILIKNKETFYSVAPRCVFVDYALVILITFYTHLFHTFSSWLIYMFRPILVIIRLSCMCCELLHCIFYR